MRVRIMSVSLAAGALLLSAVLASAQGPHARNNTRMYDPATETNLKGTIEGVTQQTRGQMMGTHITIKTADETREVMLGPAYFITGKGFAFAKGDSIEVTGSKITMAAMEFVIAREVVKDGKTLTLRDKTGTPQWAGSGMRRGRAK
ncbi:MAG: hypothetical protein LAO55_09350 [Acidobacteriia bacterium]|nr:hypothetical protein [Terriglobia bacterium]